VQVIDQKAESAADQGAAEEGQVIAVAFQGNIEKSQQGNDRRPRGQPVDTVAEIDCIGRRYYYYKNKKRIKPAQV